ncbi:NAD(P)-binding protein [Mycena venus]|uniref:NAD(P)-binding protein n=1 Tax=Mycena venus TaxID=2733690 RepID=A0A8H6Y7W5_9AGAR|nr:NAD(P)-binding protein [Mycena venus]
MPSLYVTERLPIFPIILILRISMPVISCGEVSYITGAASGIGRGLGTMLVSQRGRVIVADLNAEAGYKFASELNEKAGSIVAISVKVDTTIWEDQLVAFQQAANTFGRIDYDAFSLEAAR